MADRDAEPQDDVFDLDRLKKLVELMKCHDLSEVDLKQHSQRIRLRRAQPQEQGTALPPAPRLQEPQPGVPPDSEAAAANTESGSIVTITSPMVGTFYRSPKPDAEPLVKVGDHVNPETVVCIIEAMKVFNDIPAEVSGKVVAILAENEDAVDYGRPLFKVDTSK